MHVLELARLTTSGKGERTFLLPKTEDDITLTYRHTLSVIKDKPRQGYVITTDDEFRRIVLSKTIETDLVGFELVDIQHKLFENGDVVILGIINPIGVRKSLLEEIINKQSVQIHLKAKTKDNKLIRIYSLAISSKS